MSIPGDELERQNPFAAPNVDAGTDHGEPGNQFLSICFRPRRTIRSVIAENPSKHVTLLSCLSGIGQTLDRAASRNAGDGLPLIGILGVALLAGPLFGVVGVWISAFFVHASGRWIGGTGSRRHLVAALAWAYVPQIATLPVWAVAIGLLREDLFNEVSPRLQSSPALLTTLICFGGVQVIAGIWCLVLSCNTIAEVQGFRSAWAGLGNIILACLLLIVPLLAIVFFVAIVASA